MTAWRNYKGYPTQGRSNNKYRNNKIEIDGHVFDSRKEAKRYRELKLLEDAGEIKNLRMQVKYVLLPVQREPDTIGKRGGIKKGKVIERECDYIADFVYEKTDTGETVVEDTKGLRLPIYVVKRKMMLYFHGIRISEI